LWSLIQTTLGEENSLIYYWIASLAFKIDLYFYISKASFCFNFL